MLRYTSYVIFFLCLFTILPLEATWTLDPDRYIQAAQDKKYNNVCLIRSYTEDKQSGFGSGTLCERNGKSFILSGAHVCHSGTRHTATFDDGVEHEIDQFDSMMSFLSTENHTSAMDAIQHDAEMDIAMGFLKSIPKYVTPAQLVILQNPYSNNLNLNEAETEEELLARQLFNNGAFFDEPENRSILVVHNLFQIKNHSCCLVGYGGCISRFSHPHLIVSDNTEPKQKSVMTTTVNYVPEHKGRMISGALTSTFLGCDHPDATPLELPLLPGFDGSGLRNDKDEVFAIANYKPSFNISETFETLHPITSRSLNILEKIMHACNSHGVQYASSAVCLSNLYLNLMPEVVTPIFTALNVGVVALGLLDEPVRSRLFPVGTHSSFISVLPWLDLIDRRLESYDGSI